jgi:N-methylhydantoinase A/oxoprolinase/acetone carboxylase beta subunit
MAVDLVQSAPAPLSRIDWAATARLLEDIERRGRALLELDGQGPETIEVERSVDMRYVGQAHEITIRLPVDPDDPGIEGALKRAFDTTYLALYAVLNDTFDLEVLNWRVRVSGPRSELWFASGRDEASRPASTRSVWDGRAQSFVDAPVLEQAAMESGEEHPGPIVVEQRETTSLLFTGDRCRLDEHGNLLIQVAG